MENGEIEAKVDAYNELGRKDPTRRKEKIEEQREREREREKKTHRKKERRKGRRTETEDTQINMKRKDRRNVKILV